MAVLITPVERRSVADAVHDQLRTAILDGSLAPGEALPGERQLAERFGVNRHALREALKRLAQVRLVEVSHGGSTRVLDWRDRAGLDLLAELGCCESEPPELVRSALEMRRSIGIDVARLCAERAPAEAIVALHDHVAAARAGAEPRETYDRFWRLLVTASGNLAYLLAYNSLVEAMNSVPGLAARASEGEAADHDAHAALVEAIAARDADAAAALAESLLERMLRG